MGNVTSNQLRNPNTSGGASKVILWNGMVEEFLETLTVAELMMDHPKQVVVEFRHECITGKIKPTPLPADQNLDPDKIYLMLPANKRGKPLTFSGEEAQRLLMIANTSLQTRTGTVVPGSRFLPLLVRVCAGPGMAADAVSDKFTVRKKKGYGDDVAVREKWAPEIDVADECEEGGLGFVSGRRLGKAWKPSLDTIVEKEVEKKVNHWLF